MGFVRHVWNSSINAAPFGLAIKALESVHGPCFGLSGAPGFGLIRDRASVLQASCTSHSAALGALKVPALQDQFSAYLSIYPSIYLSICLSVYLYVQKIYIYIHTHKDMCIYI